MFSAHITQDTILLKYKKPFCSPSLGPNVLSALSVHRRSFPRQAGIFDICNESGKKLKIVQKPLNYENF